MRILTIRTSDVDSLRLRTASIGFHIVGVRDSLGAEAMRVIPLDVENFSSTIARDRPQDRQNDQRIRLFL